MTTGLCLPERKADLWLFERPEEWHLAEKFARLLDVTECERAARFRTAELRDSFVFSHGRLRQVLGRYLDLSPEDVPIEQKMGGKPAVALAGAPDFNLSHSGAFTLIGVSRHRIGVDIEVMRPLRDRDSIAERNFAPREVAALASMAEAEREDGFYACWTRKEAYVKAIGLGLAEPLDRFAVSVDPQEEAELLEIDQSRKAAAHWRLWSACVADGVWAACAAECADIRFELFTPQ